MMSAEQDKRLHSNISLVLPPHHIRLRIVDNVLAEVIHFIHFANKELVEGLVVATRTGIAQNRPEIRIVEAQ
jgi:hypothetical protein